MATDAARFASSNSAKLQKLESDFIMKRGPEMRLTLRRDSNDRPQAKADHQAIAHAGRARS